MASGSSRRQVGSPSTGHSKLARGVGAPDLRPAGAGCVAPRAQGDHHGDGTGPRARDPAGVPRRRKADRGLAEGMAPGM